MGRRQNNLAQFWSINDWLSSLIRLMWLFCVEYCPYTVDQVVFREEDEFANRKAIFGMYDLRVRQFLEKNDVPFN